MTRAINNLDFSEWRAIEAFANVHGKKWKASLRECWESGQYPSDADSQSLQQLRNQRGPAWLTKFRLSEVSIGGPS